MGLIVNFTEIHTEIEQVLRKHTSAEDRALGKFMTPAVVEKLKKEGVRVNDLLALYN